MNRIESSPVPLAVDAAAPLPTTPLDARTLLARVNRRIALLREAIGRDHGDEAHWSALGMTAREAQSDRAVLRLVANLLHVERAHARGRLHGTRFESLDEQREWLEGYLARRCGRAAQLAELPLDATLGRLRAGLLPREPVARS